MVLRYRSAAVLGFHDLVSMPMSASSEDYRAGMTAAQIVTLFKEIGEIKEDVRVLRVEVAELKRYRATVAGIAFAVSTGAAFLWQWMLAWVKQGRGGM